MKKTVGIIFGGRSGEHEISIRSAATVIKEINHDKFNVVPVAISKAGEWQNPTASVNYLPKDVRELFAGKLDMLPTGNITLIGNKQFKGLASLDGDKSVSLDVVLPVLHGTYGEDGTIQGLFEMANIPYVGCGVLASACGMDKVVMKALFVEAQLPICKHLWFLRSEWEHNQSRVLEQIENVIGFPSFVKPANLGSSVGVSKAVDADSLRVAIDLACEFDRKIIVEEALDIREIECAVIGNETPEASLPGEYIIRDRSKKFLDYAEKYTGTGNNEFVVPAPVSEELSNKIREMATAAFKSIDGSGLARVDFFLVNDTGTLLINEINTLPGLTDASGFPKMWSGSGKNFTDVVEQLIELAIERYADKSRTKTTFEN